MKMQGQELKPKKLSEANSFALSYVWNPFVITVHKERSYYKFLRGVLTNSNATTEKIVTLLHKFVKMLCNIYFLIGFFRCFKKLLNEY